MSFNKRIVISLMHMKNALLSIIELITCLNFEKWKSTQY